MCMSQWNTYPYLRARFIPRSSSSDILRHFTQYPTNRIPKNDFSHSESIGEESNRIMLCGESGLSRRALSKARTMLADCATGLRTCFFQSLRALKTGDGVIQGDQIFPPHQAELVFLLHRPQSEVKSAPGYPSPVSAAGYHGQ